MAEVSPAEIIRRGRAAVRLIEAAEVLLQATADKYERVIFAEARDLAREKLRQLVAELEPAISAQIFAASENILGPVGDAGLN
jgi:hypothetical protein